MKGQEKHRPQESGLLMVRGSPPAPPNCNVSTNEPAELGIGLPPAACGPFPGRARWTLGSSPISILNPVPLPEPGFV